MTRKFLYPESQISELTGLSRTVLKSFREKYIPRSEWKRGKGKGKPILLAEVAVDRIKLKFGLEELDLSQAIQGKPEAQGEKLPCGSTDGTSPAGKHVGNGVWEYPFLPPGTIKAVEAKLLTVSALPVNKRLVFAKNGSGEVLQVIVPDNGCWAIGDPLRAKVSERHKGYYELVGKSPRRRGDRLYRYEFV